MPTNWEIFMSDPGLNGIDLGDLIELPLTEENAEAYG